MSVLDDIGDFVSPLTGKKTRAQSANDEEAQNNLGRAREAYSNVGVPNFQQLDYETPKNIEDVVNERAGANSAQAATAGPSAFDNISINPEYAGAQQAQLAALSNLARHGGRNAASDANLAAIEQAENQHARGEREAILQGENMRGRGGSGSALLAQLMASQNDTNNQSAQDTAVAGQQANTALNAGQGAAQIGSNLQNNAYNQAAQRAAAKDAIDRFNASAMQGSNQFNAQSQNQLGEFNAAQGNQANLFNSQKNIFNANQVAGIHNQSQQTNKLQLPQQTFADQMQRAGGLSGVNMNAANYFDKQASGSAQAAGNALGSMIGLGTAAYGAYNKPTPKGAGGGEALAGEGEGLEAGALLAWKGGRVPGVAAVQGNSPINDIVGANVRTSPGEVVVPRSLAMGGSPHQISSFVKHPPMVHVPGQPMTDKNKEAMLSALKHMAHRG